MTVTRNQRDDQDELMCSTNEHAITLPQSSQPSLKWVAVVLQMAQDKRHDVAAGTLRFWKEKLKKWSDEAICSALNTGKWDLFPSVDQVLTQIEADQQRKRQEAANREWDAYKERQEAAMREGKMASDEDYAYMRQRVRELFGGGDKK